MAKEHLADPFSFFRFFSVRDVMEKNLLIFPASDDEELRIVIEEHDSFVGSSMLHDDLREALDDVVHVSFTGQKGRDILEDLCVDSFLAVKVVGPLL